MMRRAMLRMLAFVALVVAGTTLLVAPANASTDPVVVSSDGVTYGDDLAASLFAGVLIVPGKSVTRSFWVKNQTALPGNLAVALKGVTGGDTNLIAALSIRAATPSGTGANTAFTAANPCVPLLSGVPLAGGAVVKVDVRLTLSSSLGGQTSQGSVGRFDIPVTLTDAAVSPAPTGCVATTPVDPPDPGGGGTGTPGGSDPGTIGSVVISGAADGTVPEGEIDNGPLAGLGGKGYIRGTFIEPNTGRFWQEFDITGYLVLFALGGIFAWWRRRRDLGEEAYA